MSAANSLHLTDRVLPSVITAIAASLVGAAGLWFREWRARRNIEVRRRRELDEAQAYLTFLAQWFKVYEAVSPGFDIAPEKAWAASYLENKFQILQVPVDDVQSRPERTPFWGRVRAILLLYPLHSIPASIARLMFYGALFLVCEFGLAFLLLDGGWASRIGWSASVIALGFGILFVLWHLVVALSLQTADPRLRPNRLGRGRREPNWAGWGAGQAPPSSSSSPPDPPG
ncbi:hypothetical protein [Streptomyces sp. NRRL B-24484]|uniref:hypothetical protein n=1 Tax=Streptomyces sp. NRRL B-24484 TaxID=1463833 RepID=UPI001331629F|nr:hypothetical protein [Streptomyces sp. NRRL B-24484]